MENIIETRGVVKKYGEKLAVNNVSIHVRRGDIYGLIGKNGAGKTSLMKLILGITFPSSGQIELFGGEPLDKARRRIGSLIEEPGLFKNCTAYENMLRYSILIGSDKNAIPGLLEIVGLADTGKKQTRSFSQGMKQRLGIAIAMLGEPEIMILDEPINGLDPAGIKEIRDTILRLNHEKGVTFIISSHLLDELAKVVNNYGIINNGLLVEEITAAALEEKCSRQIKILTNDSYATLDLLRKKYPDILADVHPDGLHVYNYLEMTAEINAYLVRNDVPVYELSRSGKDFEQFFIERLGE